mmetsp:Transcript_830/g.1144  ORF Transcript_830/g.1144 Transcript_830/m.1144 type:complete len:91 (+) Transcript_830:451-723(+)
MWLNDTAKHTVIRLHMPLYDEIDGPPVPYEHRYNAKHSAKHLPTYDDVAFSDLLASFLQMLLATTIGSSWLILPSVHVFSFEDSPVPFPH